ncbi:hypothetical protein [Scopulibacillus darangshiensis]|nr:hypothetical protein [Scopulibacillus darangshiensis]
MLKHVDWQLVLFVAVSVSQDYLFLKNLPRVYFYDTRPNANPPKAA